MEKNPSNGFRKIYLSGKNGDGLCALVDPCDYDRLAKYRWFIIGGYAKRVEHYKNKNGERSSRTIAMHRDILHPPKNKMIDHKNHNRLDNRRDNLKICTARENRANTKLSNYRWSARLGRWVVTFKRDGRWLKRYFKTEEEAKRQSKLANSGVNIQRQKREKNKYMPKNIARYALSDGRYKYLYRQKKDKIIYYKCGFDTILEAVEYRDRTQKTLKGGL